MWLPQLNVDVERLECATFRQDRNVGLQLADNSVIRKAIHSKVQIHGDLSRGCELGQLIDEVRPKMIVASDIFERADSGNLVENLRWLRAVRSHQMRRSRGTRLQCLS